MYSPPRALGGLVLIIGLEYRHYLLAAGGINTDEALRDLDSIDFHTAFEPSSVRVDTDIDVCAIVFTSKMSRH